MIDDLDRSLKLLLEQEVEDLTEVLQNVRFETPDDTFNPPLPAINLFLYDVRENRELRSNEWVVERQNGNAIKKRPPARIDCSYLITAWAGDIASEHLLLGKVMRALLRYPTLPDALLQGTLQGQDPPLPTTALQAGRLQSLGEFWQALGGKPKAALAYTATISVTTHEPVDAGPVVTDLRVNLRQGVEE